MSSGPRSRFLLQISALTMFFFACLLLSGLVLTSGQSESNATLSDIKIWPCSGTTHENVSLYKSDIYTVVNSVSLCGDNWTPSTANVNTSNGLPTTTSISVYIIIICRALLCMPMPRLWMGTT